MTTKRSDRAVKTATPLLPPIKALEAVLGAKAATWKGQCYGVASTLVRQGAIAGKAVYGHWLGPIAPKSFFAKRAAVPFVPHGWIRMEHGGKTWIVDPTRWVFEAAKPYLFVGPAKGHPEYDEGGNRFRAAMTRPPPPYEPNPWNGEWQIVPLELDEETRLYVNSLLGDDQGITMARAFWLANLALPVLGDRAWALYQALVKAELTELIPLDNRRAVLEG